MAIIVTGGCEPEAIRWQTREPERDLVAMLRVRRLRWLGHVLRMSDDRRLKKLVLKFNAIYPDGYPEGSILMDAPDHNSVAELEPMAADRKMWAGLVSELKTKLGVSKGGPRAS